MTIAFKSECKGTIIYSDMQVKCGVFLPNKHEHFLQIKMHTIVYYKLTNICVHLLCGGKEIKSGRGVC